MSKKREYDEEYKEQAVKLAKNLGSAKAAAEELQIPVNTLYGWIQKVKTAELDIGCGERSPEEALSIAKENQQLKKRIKALEKENRRLSEMNEFLAAKILRSGCRRTLRFIILVGNVSSVIDNFKVDFSTTNKYYVDDCTDSNQNNYAHYNLFYSRRLVHFAQ